MRLGTLLRLGTSWPEVVDEVVALEKAGLDVVWVPEAYGYDAVSLVGALAVRTSRIALGTGILPVQTRTPTLIAMTAAGLDALSGGRFELGLGSSGPQVIEGWHGLPFDAPLARTRETVEICRQAWRREGPLAHTGEHFTIPRPNARALKLINRPVRARIPIVLGALGPANVAMAAELADGWLPAMYWPERAGQAWAEPLAKGTAHRGPDLGPLDIIAGAPLHFTDNKELRNADRPHLAHYFGGMGPPDRNFYRKLLERYGYPTEAEKIQHLYLTGRKYEAATLIPQDLINGTTLIGDEQFIRDRLQAYQATGVTTLNVTPIAPTRTARTNDVARLRTLLS
jgi:F420-dependent oxidoreductase-like protein